MKLSNEMVHLHKIDWKHKLIAVVSLEARVIAAGPWRAFLSREGRLGKVMNADPKSTADLDVRSLCRTEAASRYTSCYRAQRVRIREAWYMPAFELKLPTSSGSRVSALRRVPSPLNNLAESDDKKRGSS